MAQLDEQLTALKLGTPADGAIEQLPPLRGGPTPGGVTSSQDAAAGHSGTTPTNFNAQIDELSTISKTLRVGLTVQFSGPSDLLYQPPLVRDAQGATYRITPDSLKAARLALLDLTTAGQATASLCLNLHQRRRRR